LTEKSKFDFVMSLIFAEIR